MRSHYPRVVRGSDPPDPDSFTLYCTPSRAVEREIEIGSQAAGEP